VLYCLLLYADIPYSWISICFELIPSSSKQVFNGAEIFLVDIKVFSELGPEAHKQSCSIGEEYRGFLPREHTEM
jgi:hypothetical protein